MSACVNTHTFSTLYSYMYVYVYVHAMHTCAHRSILLLQTCVKRVFKTKSILEEGVKGLGGGKGGKK
jgi:hypothetical protein